MNIHSLYKPFSGYFRRRRFLELEKWFRFRGETKVLDVGGTSFNWSLLEEKPDLTLLNLGFPESNFQASSRLKWIKGNGLKLPFPDQSFDFVYSNSVIEHVGDLREQRKFAEEIRRVGKRYYIQTPNVHFPLEPHFLTPGIQYLSPVWRRRVMRNFTFRGLITRPSPEEASHFVSGIHLLDRRTFQRLFPDAHFLPERFFGLTKSLIVIKT